jgi:hypothetical protein
VYLSLALFGYAEVSGYARTTRIMVSESTTGEATAKGFSYITVAQSIAQIAAPTIGGLLWAGDQAASSILARYPALLPCIINGAIGIITLISTLLFVKEVGQSMLPSIPLSSAVSQTRPKGPEAAKQDKQMSYPEILRQPQVASFTLLYIWEWSQGSAVRASKCAQSKLCLSTDTFLPSPKSLVLYRNKVRRLVSERARN